MVADTFKESKESYYAQFRTKWGILDFILANLIWGFLVLKYIYVVEGFILDKISGLPQFLIEPTTWILIGIFSSILGYILLLFMEQVIKFLGIKNKKIF